MSCFVYYSLITRMESSPWLSYTICTILDCYRTTMPIQYTQKEIAISCLFLATMELGEPPVASKAEGELTWLDLFDSDISDEKSNMLGQLWLRSRFKNYSNV